MCFILEVYILKKGKNMIKTKTFTISVVSFLLIFNICISTADANNPFTTKGKDEFTLDDSKRMQDSIQSEVNRKITSLEKKLNKEIEDIKIAAQKVQRSDNTRVGNPQVSGDMAPDLFDSGFEMQEEIAEVVPEEDPQAKKTKNATFIGCIDEQVLFKDNKTKEQFFVTLEEAESNEIFNKMGGCSF